MPRLPKVWSVKDAAFWMEISENHLRYLLREGIVKGKKLGRDWAVLERDYERQRIPKGHFKALQELQKEPWIRRKEKQIREQRNGKS